MIKESFTSLWYKLAILSQPIHSYQQRYFATISAGEWRVGKPEPSSQAMAQGIESI